MGRFGNYSFLMILQLFFGGDLLKWFLWELREFLGLRARFDVFVWWSKDFWASQTCLSISSSNPSLLEGCFLKAHRLLGLLAKFSLSKNPPKSLTSQNKHSISFKVDIDSVIKCDVKMRLIEIISTFSNKFWIMLYLLRIFRSVDFAIFLVRYLTKWIGNIFIGHFMIFMISYQ
jgi:hypothetical protein